MKKRIIFTFTLLSLLYSMYTCAQKIGINTTTPNALVDIRKTPNTPLNNDQPILGVSNTSNTLQQNIGLLVENAPAEGWGTGASIVGGNTGLSVEGGDVGITVAANKITFDGWGISSIISGTNGNLTGVLGAAEGQNSNLKNGLYGYSTGSGTENRGVYGSATGATTNWAGYFNAGNVYVKNKLSIGNLTPVRDLEILSDQAVARFASTNNANGAVLELNNHTASPSYLGAINFGTQNSTPGQIGYLGDHTFTIRVNNSDRIKINASGLLGIGRTPMTNRLEVEGNASKSTAGEWLGNSDARLKKNITPLDPKEMIEQLLSLQGITYEWNDTTTSMQRPEGLQYGFIAQDIRETFPTLVTTDSNGYLQTAYGTYDAMTVEAIRYLYEENNLLKKELGEIKALLQNVTVK